MADKINAAGYETKPWWPYVRELMEGGGNVTVEQLNVTENGTYTAEAGKAYSPVVVNVPSDFYKAEVTVTNNTSSSIFTVAPSTLESNQDVIAIKWGSNGVTYPENTGFYDYDANTETTDTYYIHTGGYIAGFSQSIVTAGSYTVTGNAEVLTVEGMPMVKITGDCTITISEPNT